MGYNAAPLEKLVEQFSSSRAWAGGATRMAYQVLSMPADEALELAHAIENAHAKPHRCHVCQDYTEAEVCKICSSAKRDASVICVVETRGISPPLSAPRSTTACTMCCTG